MSEWEECKLGDAVEIDSGFAFKSTLYSDKGSLRVVRGKNVTVGQTRWGCDTRYWNHPSDGLERYFLNEGDVVIGMDGSKIGENRTQIKNSDLPAILAQRVARLKAKDNSDQDFIWHLIFSYDFENYIKSIHTGTSIPHISQSQIASYDVLLPPLPEQRAIASILSSLDDKIDLLHRQNKTLEAMAETLFRQWFVEGADEGWEEGTLNDLCTQIASGGTPSTKIESYYNGDINWYSTKELKDNFLYESENKITKEGLENSSAKLFPAGTVVIAIYAAPTVGRLGILANEASFNQAACGLIANEEICLYEFIYLYLKNQRGELNAMASGSAQQNLNVRKIKEYPAFKPPLNLMNKFKSIIGYIFNKIKQNTKQIRILEKLRDTLLPKLMSGEVRVVD
ncbi:Type-1 restriction enzyme MjaXIP specificity protein [ANME-1 cluster archaeon GoMg3.2]|nr:Type-1 restriction enzyme MjaXIP specificity protein [ANME-1 cluster archaeon GoMg3.2]